MIAAESVHAIIPAAGVGRRMQSDIPKQYLRLLGRPVIAWSLERLLAHPRVSGAIVAIAEGDQWWSGVSVASDKPITIVTGGSERAASVLNALDHLAAGASPPARVLVHDAVRPCVTTLELDALLGASQGLDGALLATPVRDTLKRANDDGQVHETPDRTGLWQAQTPQCFHLDPLRRALRDALQSGAAITDESLAMERMGYHPRLVEGRTQNIKLTRPADLPLLECILRAEHEAQPA